VIGTSTSTITWGENSKNGNNVYSCLESDDARWGYGLPQVLSLKPNNISLAQIYSDAPARVITWTIEQS
jgi:hypothetical protein